MSNFVHLEKALCSDLDRANRIVIVKETKQPLGQGGRICDVKLSSKKILRDCSLGIVKNSKTNEEEVFVNSIHFPEYKLAQVSFDLTNLDF